MLPAKCAAHPGQLVGAQLGGVASQEPDDGAVLVGQRVGQLPAHADRDPRRHPAPLHLAVHPGDQVAGVHGALVDLAGELGEQGVLQHAALGVGEQQLLVAPGGGDPLGEHPDRHRAALLDHPHQDDPAVARPLGPVLVAGRRQLGGQFVQRPGQARGGLLDRGLGGPQLAGRRQDRLVQGGDLGREGTVRVVPLVVAGGPAQPGRAAQQAQDVVVGERFEALRRGPLLGPRRGQCGGRGVALGLGPRDRGRRALPRCGGGRPLVLGRGDAPLRLLDPGQHRPGPRRPSSRSARRDARTLRPSGSRPAAPRRPPQPRRRRPVRDGRAPQRLRRPRRRPAATRP